MSRCHLTYVRPPGHSGERSAGRRLDDASPWVDARLPDGTRLHAVLAPLARPGTLVSLRVLARRTFTLEQLVAAGTLTPDAERWLLRLVNARVAFVVSGGTPTRVEPLMLPQPAASRIRATSVLGGRRDELGDAEPIGVGRSSFAHLIGPCPPCSAVNIVAERRAGQSAAPADRAIRQRAIGMKFDDLDACEDGIRVRFECGSYVGRSVRRRGFWGSGMPRQMADETFCVDQFERRYEDHVKRINRYADWLSERGAARVPYVAPHQGGVGARLLSLSSNPGPKIDSGFISCENDDGSAARMAGLYETAGIFQADTVPWNAYPWFIHDELAGKGLDGTQISEGQRPLWKMPDAHSVRSFMSLVYPGGPVTHPRMSIHLPSGRLVILTGDILIVETPQERQSKPVSRSRC